MRTVTIQLLTLSMLLLVGCTLGETGIRRGAAITQVQLDCGEPDVISDRSGDQERFYVPENRPSSEWPAEAPRTFYYLDQDVFVTFVHGKAVREGVIPPEVRETILLPLIKRQSASRTGQT